MRGARPPYPCKTPSLSLLGNKQVNFFQKEPSLFSKHHLFWGMFFFVFPSLPKKTHTFPRGHRDTRGTPSPATFPPAAGTSGAGTSVTSATSGEAGEASPVSESDSLEKSTQSFRVAIFFLGGSFTFFYFLKFTFWRSYNIQNLNNKNRKKFFMMFGGQFFCGLKILCGKPRNPSITRTSHLSKFCWFDLWEKFLSYDS